MKISKTTLALLAAVLCVGGVTVYQHRTIQRVKAERDTYQQNTHGLLAQIDTLRKDSAMQAYQIQALKLDVDEYKQYRAEDLQTIKALGLKLKNVSSVSKQEMEVEAPINAPIVEKTVVQDSIVTKTQTVALHNDYINFDGTIHGDSLSAQINIPIQLTQIVHKIPKHKFLWWSWGCKAIKQVIVTNNPYVNLKYSEYIELTK